MAYAAPVFEAQPTFKPVGVDATDFRANRMSQDIDRYNEDDKAKIFQQHLQKGLSGMQEVMKELPPEVLAAVPDPSAYADSDEKRVLWYQSVNQAVNRGNMQKAAASGDIAGAENMGLFDKSATPKDFVNAAENQSLDRVTKNFNPTKKVTKTVYAAGGLKEALAGQESGNDYNVQPGPAYQKADGTTADMTKGELALGKYQIVPAFWFDKIGLDPLSDEDRKKFMATPELQDKAFDVVIQDSMSQFGGDMDKVIANYYGGPKAAALVNTPEGDKPQSAGMPSINEYVKSVKAKMGPDGMKNPEGQLVTEDKNKTQEDVALEILRDNPRLIDKIEPILKHLGKGSQDMEMLKLLQRQAEEKGKNRRSDQANNTRKTLFEDKSDQSLYDDLNKAEIPTIGQALKDIDNVLTPAGGLKGSMAKLEGTGYVQNVLTPLLKSEAGVNMNALLKRIYSLELKRISGVAVSDAEFNRYKEVFSTKGTNSAAEQMYALRAFVRAYRSQLKLAKAAYGKSWDRVAPAAGLDLDQIPDVPDSNGKAPETPVTPGSAPTPMSGPFADEEKNKRYQAWKATQKAK